MEVHRQILLEKGVTLVKNFYPQALISSALEAVDRQLDSMAGALKRSGKLSSQFREYDIHSRLGMIESEVANAGTLLHKQPTLSPEFKTLWGGDETLGKVTDILQTSDLMACPVWNLRCKSPEKSSQNHATVPFHQDIAYLDSTANDTFVLTAWVPLVPVTQDIGPMEYYQGAWWKKRQLMTHTGCWRNTWYLDVDKKVIEETQAANPELGPVSRMIVDIMEPGDAILFDSYTPHRSLPNITTSTRWSLDLRWSQAGTPQGCKAPGILMGSAAKYGQGFDNIDWASSQLNIPTPWDQVKKVTRPPQCESETEKRQRLADDQLRNGLLSPLIGGGWMDRWEMTNANEHVKAYKNGTLPEIPRLAKMEEFVV